MLRDYQTEAVERLRDGIRQGHRRILLSAATGSGKTVIAADMIRRCLEKGKRCAFLAERRVLVDQTARRLASESLPVGIIMRGATRGKTLPVQVCSQQTLEARDEWPDHDLIIVDECHMQRKRVSDWIRRGLLPHQVVIGLTATPFDRGLGTTYSLPVTVRPTNQLIDEGWLVPIRVFACDPMDMSGVRPSSTGEWRGADLTERGKLIVGDIVSNWTKRTQDLFGGAAKTLVFSATVEHGRDLRDAFRAAGYRAEQISYLDKNSDHRDTAIEDFRTGRIDLLISVDVCSRGFDVPDVRVLVDAHPYRNAIGAYIQMIGRVMRPAEKTRGEDEYGVILDHTGVINGPADQLSNYVRFYDRMQTFFAEGIDRLISDKGEALELSSATDRKPWECECETLNDWASTKCTFCGTPRPTKKYERGLGAGNGSGVSVMDGSSREIEGVGVNKPPNEPWKANPEEVWRQLCLQAVLRGKASEGSGDSGKRFALALYRQAMGRWPRWGKEFDPAVFEDADIRSWVDRHVRNYARRKSYKRTRARVTGERINL